MTFCRVCEFATVVALTCVVTSVAAQDVLMTPDEIQKTWVDKRYLRELKQAACLISISVRQLCRGLGHWMV
jgi:hypothetical protein